MKICKSTFIINGILLLAYNTILEVPSSVVLMVLSSQLNIIIYFYVLTYHKNVTLPYLGALMCIKGGIIESFFLSGVISPKVNSLDPFAMLLCLAEIISVQQTLLNWKLKSMFFAFSRLMPLLVYAIRFGKF